MEEWMRQRWRQAVEDEAGYLEARAASRRTRHGWAKSIGSAMAGAQTTTAGVGSAMARFGSAGSTVAGAGRRYGAGMGRSPSVEALDPCAADPPTPLASRCVAASSYPPACP